jgi:hypothetical protein
LFVCSDLDILLQAVTTAGKKESAIERRQRRTNSVITTAKQHKLINKQIKAHLEWNNVSVRIGNTNAKRAMFL